MKKWLALIMVCAVLIGSFGCGVVNKVKNEVLRKLIEAGLEGTDAQLISCDVTNELVTIKLLAPEGSAEVAMRYDSNDDCRNTWDSTADQFAGVSATVAEELRAKGFKQEVEIWIINDQKPDEDFAILICRSGKIVYSVVNDAARKAGLMNPLDNDELRRYLEDLMKQGDLPLLSCDVTDDQVVIKTPAADGTAAALSLYNENDEVKTQWGSLMENILLLSETLAAEAGVKGKAQGVTIWFVSDLDRDTPLLICENGVVTYNIVDGTGAEQ